LFDIHTKNVFKVLSSSKGIGGGLKEEFYCLFNMKNHLYTYAGPLKVEAKNISRYKLNRYVKKTCIFE